MFHVMTAPIAIGGPVKPIRMEFQFHISMLLSKTTTSNAGKDFTLCRKKNSFNHQAEMQGGFFMLIFACEGGEPAGRSIL